jgi:hypothetical protein
MVPHLGDRLMECSEEESMGIADLVCVFNAQIFSTLTTYYDAASERCFGSKVG